MKSQEELEAELEALGWRITEGPSQTADGWTATMQRGSVQMTAWTKLGLLEDMLRNAQRRARKP